MTASEKKGAGAIKTMGQPGKKNAQAELAMNRGHRGQIRELTQKVTPNKKNVERGEKQLPHSPVFNNHTWLQKNEVEHAHTHTYTHSYAFVSRGKPFHACFFPSALCHTFLYTSVIVNFVLIRL